MKSKGMVNSNYIWRVFFTFLIVIGHSGYVNISKASYYIGVDYFFIFSGLMIAYGIDYKQKTFSTFEFTLGRIAKLYPHLLLSFSIYFIYMSIGKGIHEIIVGLISYLYQVIPMMYYIMPSNPTFGYLNFSVWYISVLLIAGIFVHYMYLNHKQAFVNCIAALIVLEGYYYLTHNCNCFNTGDPIGPFLNNAYVRGVTDMCGGGDFI